jgi:hypothetical protein
MPSFFTKSLAGAKTVSSCLGNKPQRTDRPESKAVAGRIMKANHPMRKEGTGHENYVFE